DHFRKQSLWNGLSRFEMSREKVERLAVPAEVFHDLRWQFDEIPRHGGSCERFHRHIAKQAVQKMAEFMENRFHFAVCQQRGSVPDWWTHIADDQPEVGLAG